MVLQQRFWDKVNKGGDGGCWLWTGAITTGGYGDYKLDGQMRKAHRVALADKLGRPLGAGMEACHSCRNRHCVNPEHLREDTKTGNQRDRVKDGTDNRGGRCGTAKLTEQNVLDIFNSDKSSWELAGEYGVSPATIWLIQKGRNWSWLTS